MAPLVRHFVGVSNVSTLAEIPSGAAILDLGCDAGSDALLAARRVGPAGKVIAVDFPETRIFLFAFDIMNLSSGDPLSIGYVSAQRHKYSDVETALQHHGSDELRSHYNAVGSDCLIDGSWSTGITQHASAKEPTSAVLTARSIRTGIHVNYENFVSS